MAQIVAMDVWKAGCLEQRFEIASDEFRFLNRTSALSLEDEFARFCFGRSVFFLQSAKETYDYGELDEVSLAYPRHKQFGGLGKLVSRSQGKSSAFETSQKMASSLT